MDMTGSVRVTVDVRGDVVDIEIRDDWRDHVDVDGFASAVLEAYVNARTQAFEAFALAVLAAERAGETPFHPPPSPQERSGDGLERAPVAPPTERRRTGPHGCLVATVHGTSVVSMVGHADRIRGASTEHLRDEALAVLSAVSRRNPAQRGEEYS